MTGSRSCSLRLTGAPGRSRPTTAARGASPAGAALARVMGSAASSTPCLRMKSAHADLGAAASPVELLACSAALEHATLPRAVVEPPLPPTSPHRSALVISLGLFGECAALMVRR